MQDTGERVGEGADSEDSDLSFVRTEDIICLACTNGDSIRRGYLSAKGFGSQLCHLVPEPLKQDPCELWRCTFQVEDSMSVHAMYTYGLSGRKDKKVSSRKILMYGHAVLLRHVATQRLLSCLTTSPSNDKMAYNIGFLSAVGECSWYTVHPSSNQRSEGEKVRAGDDIYLVSVSNERYLSAEMAFFHGTDNNDPFANNKFPLVQASFHQCVWSLNIVLSGSAKEAAVGFVNGGDVVRLVHRYRNKGCLSVGTRECDVNVKLPVPEKADVGYEKLGDKSHLRSLWRVELFQMRFGGGFTSWGQPFRLKHLVTGKYLGVKVGVRSCEGGGGVTVMRSKSEAYGGGKGEGECKRQVVCLLDQSQANKDNTAFCFSKASGVVPKTVWCPVECMGTPEVCFGDSEVYLTHINSGKVVGCPVAERRVHLAIGSQGAVLSSEIHRMFAFTVTRAPEEETSAATIIDRTQKIMRNYVHKVLMSSARVSSVVLERELTQVLSELCHYFTPPCENELCHEDCQRELRALRERQSLFKKQGSLQFILSVIVEMSRGKGGSTAAQGLLYQLLAAMIRGNHDNCRAFATQRWLRVFMEQLSASAHTHHVLDVIQCLLTDSPEVLHIITQRDIGSIVKLLHTNGRDAKVMKLLASLCVCKSVAMRDKQRHIFKHLKACKDLLLHTTLKDRVHSVHPSVYVGSKDNSALYSKWYFEVKVTRVQPQATINNPHFRVGWAHPYHFQPHPSASGCGVTDGGVGDDVFSIGFDGLNFWVGGHSLAPPTTRRLVRQSESVAGDTTPKSETTPTVSEGDVIGCCLDLERGVVWYMRNGERVTGELGIGHCRDMLTPAVSFSAGISAMVSLGGHYGNLSYTPPTDYTPLIDAADPTSDVCLLPFRCLGVSDDLIVTGPMILADYEAFVPAPIVTANISLPDPLLRSGLKDRLAENIHEVWAKNKIEAGFTYAETRDDKLRHNPSLEPFYDLSEGDRQYDYDMALGTLSTLVALGYQISTQDDPDRELPYMDLPPDKYRMSNGYIPQPLNLEMVTIPKCLRGLVDKLAENAHHVWAAGRISQGWTFGAANDKDRKRNRLLVPYGKLDEATRKSNEDTALESVRTIIALGCTIAPPTDTGGDIRQLARKFTDSQARIRTFRGQTCYTLTSGKWYYEVKLLTGGLMRVGWATPDFPSGRALGTDKYSYGFDGFLACKWHDGSNSFGQRWKAGDVVGCLLDIDQRTMSFTLNGEFLHDTHSETTLAFTQITSSGGFVPAITLSAGERAKFNFGRSLEAMHHDYTASGFTPVCAPTALPYNLPLWYSSHGGYDTIDHTHSTLTAKSKPTSLGEPDSMISVTLKDWDISVPPKQECLRLCVGVAFSQTTPTPEEGGERVCFSAVFSSGQDPDHVFVGWTTPEFRYIESQFKPSNGSIPDHGEMHFGQGIDMIGPSKGGVVHYSTAFMMSLSELLDSSEPLQVLPHTVTVVCVLDFSTSKLEFSVECPPGSTLPAKKKEVLLSHNTKLFPTAVTTPTTDRVINFDLSPRDGTIPLSWHLFSTFLDTAGLDSDSTHLPVCPPRFKVQSYVESRWVRQVVHKSQYSSDVAPSGHLQLSANRDRSFSVILWLPQEEETMDILELSEYHPLMDFHIQTLDTYCAVCSHSNLELAAQVSKCLKSSSMLRYMTVAKETMRYNLMFAYLKLFFALHLKHEVNARLAMRAEFVIPLSECTQSVSLFPLPTATPTQQKVFRLSHAPMPGKGGGVGGVANQLCHNVSSSFSRLPRKGGSKVGVALDQFSLEELKNHVFSNLDTLLSSRSYRVKLLPSTISEIFVPLITALDHLLVIGGIQGDTDVQKLLELLDPKLFCTENQRKGLLSDDVACEEPIKLALCDLLHHLCDCQVQHRVESVVTFASGYVHQLQEEQKQRHQKYFHSKPREFRCPPEMQLAAMLAQKPSPGLSKLHDTLTDFHHKLHEHCGGSEVKGQPFESLSTSQKLTQIVALINSPDESDCHDNKGSHVTSLRELITKTMVKWAESEIKDSSLICKIFSLLHRQFDEVTEVAEALKRTYVIDLTGEKVKQELGDFIHALGSLRLLLSVGMGKSEETFMKESLSTIQQSQLFYCHPHLLRQLGVHTTILGLIRTYLGISCGSDKRPRSGHRRMSMRNFGRGAPPPVEDCCRFLCTFARISQENQRVLFCHLGYLLKHMEKYPDLMLSSGCTPLDVATATIKDNQELTLALEESQLENVVQLLVAITTSFRGSQDLSDVTTGNDLGLVHSSSFSVNFDWNPRVGGKCLQFLQRAVWVDNEQIQENAYSVVRLLIRHSECMGPALAGEALGLYSVYKEAIEKLDAELGSEADNSTNELGALNESFSSSSSLFSRQSTIFNVSTLSTKCVLTYYTSLVQLLASCAPHMNDHAPTRSNTLNKRKEGSDQRTQNILRNLVKVDDIINILSLPYASEVEPGVRPTHKRALVWFLTRVYEITDQEVLFNLLSRAFLPDVKLTLRVAHKGDENKQFSRALNQYMCSSVLPLLAQCAPLFKQLLSHLHVLVGFLNCCIQLYISVPLSSAQLDCVADFLMAVFKELHPRALQRYMPTIISHLHQVGVSSTVHYKVLSAQYTHFARYYQSGSVDKSFLGHAYQDEKVAAALVVHRLLDTLASELPEDGQILRHAVSCLKAATCALSPDSLVPLLEHLNTLYPSSPRNYEPRPLDTTSVTLTAVHKQLIGSYVSYRHDCWVYERQCNGWSYGDVVDPVRLKHPNIRPFSSLSEEEQSEESDRVEGVVKALLLKGYSLSKQFTLDPQTIPCKPKKMCTRRSKKSALGVVSQWEETPYEPEVLDLTRVELRIDQLATAETLAEDMHEHWALKLKQTSPDCHDNQSFLPYVLLEEAQKEELRSYVTDLLKFFKVSGYEASFTLRKTSSSTEESRASKDKFGVQLFDKLLSLLSSPAHSFHTQVLFPVLTAFISHHAPYFMPPLGGHRGHSFASKPEKAKILRIFCRVMEYTRQSLPTLLRPITTPPSVLGHSPKEGGGCVGDTDSNWVTMNCILSLVKSLISAMDVRGVLEGGEELTTECPEMVDFFRQAVSGIHLTTKNLSKLDKLDAQFHFYCLHLLTPTLGTLFSHLGLHCSGRLLITGPVQTHCRYIFQNLVEMAVSSGPVYVGSSPLITIGQCMGSFALAYPDPFLENETFGFSLASLLEQLHRATVQGVTCGNVLFVVDIIVPVLTSYLSHWMSCSQGDGFENSVTMATVDEVVGAILLLLEGHFSVKRISWFPRILSGALLLANKSSLELLPCQLVELVTTLRERAISLWREEQYVSATWSQGLVEDEGTTDHTQFITEDYRVFTRDLSTILSFLFIYLNTHSTTLRPHSSTPSHVPTEEITEAVNNLFVSLADIFHCWSSSQIFKREFQTATFTLAEHCPQFQMCRALFQPWAGRPQAPQSKKPPNLLLVCLELLLPLSDQGLSLEDRLMVDNVKEKLGKKKMSADDLKDELVQELEMQATRRQPLTRQLIRKFSQRLLSATPGRAVEERAIKIISLAKVRHKLEQVERGHLAQSRWRQLFSQRKRKAIVKCFLAVPFFRVTKHRSINMFLEQYCVSWLSSSEHGTHLKLTEELLDRQDYLTLQRSHDQSRDQAQLGCCQMDPLSQLFKMFKRMASAYQFVDSSLYTAYAELLSKSVVGHEDEELDDDDYATKAYELYSQHKAELVHKQGQLADRGAHSMVLLVVTATQGKATSLVHSTLKLGIALLKEGNKRVQEEMLAELRGMDVGFLSSIACLISSCGVLDWNVYQRFNKSEAATASTSVCKVFPQAPFITSLFRFLQLLCEGHNQSFQDYLRTQAGNTTTVNIVVCTVDYLLRLQESISDFYWHYSDCPIIDLQGRENFLKAFKVAKQVVRTLTEYTQGPCVRNQECLARSRLWDAVSGFLHIFSVLQRKFYRETSQMELLRELLGLQEEVFILLLSLLEGSTMSSNIGRLMLDMLLESSVHIQDIAQFFLIFVKLKDAITSKAFREYDLNKDGFISYREFEKAMEAQQRYSKEEIVYLMECADLNKDGLLDYMEFTERFHQPAKSIGLHLCVLIVNLSDLLPSDPRLTAFKQVTQLKELMTHFERNMGCIEILGKSGRVERVYFEVQKSRRQQWKETQIQESRVNFLHSVEMSSQKNKLKGFVSFCEDAIFEMDQADKISGSEQQAMESRASQHRRSHNTMTTSRTFLSRIRAGVSALRQNDSYLTRLVTSVCSLVMWVWLLMVATLGKVRDSVRSGLRTRPGQAHPPPAITVSTSHTTTSGKRPANLTISIKAKDQTESRKARTTTREYRPPLGVGVANSISAPGSSKMRTTRTTSLANGADSAVRSEYKRWLSHDSRRGGSLSPSPHLHTAHTLTLSYDRSRMKRPSMSMDTPTPEGLLREKSDNYVPGIAIATRSWSSLLAKHYYNLNSCKFVLTFLINLILLTFKVTSFDHTYSQPSAVTVNGTLYELQNPFWDPLLLEGLAFLHFAVSAILIASYWFLKVPLIIFKREKEIARKLELKQLWVSEDPECLRDRWDWLLVTSHTFPRNYFDKQVKRRVCESQGSAKFKERACRLGMLTRSKFEKRTKFERIMEMCQSLCDLKYYVWVFGVTVSDMVIQYQVLYCVLSFIGLKWNVFFFSIHLLDLVMSFKLLRTVLKSVLNNYKQLAMTVLMTCVVIYIYTVIAFNFFRKFYRQTTPEGLPVQTCDSMFRCFIYHIDQGLRSGGGIADVLESASGDPNEFTRLFFDITFFFVVIVILLAIIQGLIIDSFGELRDREETLTNEMATKCFICGQTKSTFDRVPHGFERHISREHNMAHYMFFLLYLIKKKESEFSGQESYVWEMYLKQDWDFFPVGDCFKSQQDLRIATPLPGGSGRGKPEGGGSSSAPNSPVVLRRAQTSPSSN